MPDLMDLVEMSIILISYISPSFFDKIY